MPEPIWSRLIEEIDAFTREIRGLPVTPRAGAGEIRSLLALRFPLDGPMPLDALFEDARALLRTGIVHVTHPRYFGLFNPSVREASIVADALAALYNPQLAAWSHAPAVNEMERHTLRRFASLLGMDPEAIHANFTSGGAEANHSALLVALAHAFPAFPEEGAAEIGAAPVVYVTSDSHHSVGKAARMSGLGSRALREIPVTARFTMDPAALRDAVAEDRRAGRRPFFVTATAGTTGAGAIDPLPEIADVARDEGLWLHVDGAWGASAALSPALRPALAGIERSDSVTWDAHKGLSVPMGAGMFFTRHPDAARRAFAIPASYMPPLEGEGTVDPYASTMQWSRRAIGLKVFLALAELGVEGYAALVERQARMGELLRARLRRAGWRIVNATPLPLVCFTHDDLDSGRVDRRALLARIYERGRVWISEVELGGRVRALRACITSFRTDEADLDVLIDEIERGRITGRSGSPP